MRKVLTLLIGLWLAPIGSAHADDVVGSWRLDVEGFQAQMRSFIEAQMAAMPQEMRAQMELMMDGMIQQLQSDMAGVATLNADGTAEFVADNGEREVGSWSRQDAQTVLIVPDDGDPMPATVDGDRLVMRMDDPDMPVPVEMIWFRE